MAAFALTIFTGAFLLFQVQPVIGKYILPWFGGGPGVWTTCMLFFQVLLLAGYAYAHFASRCLIPRVQAIVHLALIGAALAMLPITPADSWKPGAAGDPTLQILALLTVSIGLPYFVLSATGPLIQQWFSLSRPGISPYRLYALSNAGSLLALLSYPLLFESHLTRKLQASLWGWSLGIYALCCVPCAWKLWKASGPGIFSPGPPPPGAQNATCQSVRPATADRVLWLALPACASVLLLATTNKMCQDVAVIPFLWVLPLSLYLLSFIICFDSPRGYRRLPYTLALAAALAAICWVMWHALFTPVGLQVSVYSAGLFICCMVCHGELYRLRPDPEHLTGFYLMIAAGGALGGAFVAIVAPLIFSDYFELHWGLVGCALLCLVVWLRQRAPTSVIRPHWMMPSALAVGLLALGFTLWANARAQSSYAAGRSRTFYGVLTLYKKAVTAGKISALELTHGTTAHGMQFMDPVRASWPTYYYTEDSGVGLAIRALPSQNRRFGLVGLGVGTLATYARPGDWVRIYEINPEVYRLAMSRFTYLSNCSGKVEVVLGDARLSLEREPWQSFDLLVLDAFSSDAIPVHLLTSEALEVYGRHLNTNGIIAVHISNRHLDLEPVITRLADHFQYHAAVVENIPTPEKYWIMPSKWLLLSHREETIRSLSTCAGGRQARASAARTPLWSDDFASLYPIVRWGARLHMEPRLAEAEVAIAGALWEKGELSGAITHFRAALKFDPDFAEASNNLAWLLATSPDLSLRNGPEAVRLAERACKLTGYQKTIMVGTLAAAYAEVGRFPDAVVTAEKACRLASAAGEDALLKKNEELLQLYRARKPYRER